jgi:hypothetical protein
MSEFKAACGLGVLAAVITAGVLAVGCSAAAPDAQGGAVPEVTDHGTSPEYFQPPQYAYATPGNPIGGSCIYWNGVTYQYLTPHYVEKIPNNWGANYAPWNGRDFNDGYSIPFPTPWIQQGSTQPDPFTYEDMLWNIPSTLFWEYLVHDITPPPAGGRTYTVYVGHAYFFVGIPSMSDYPRASSLAAQNTGYPVEARVNQCVRVLTRSNGLVFDTGEWYFVYDEHDPISPPGKCGGANCT